MCIFLGTSDHFSYETKMLFFVYDLTYYHLESTVPLYGTPKMICVIEDRKLQARRKSRISECCQTKNN